MGGFVRSTWDEATEITAASLLYTAKHTALTAIAGFSVIPAMSMLSCCSRRRSLNLMGGSHCPSMTGMPICHLPALSSLG